MRSPIAAKTASPRPRASLLIASVVLALAGSLAAVAAATTGPGYLLKAPNYRLPLSVLKAYTGRYTSTSVAHNSGITSSELYIGVAESGYAAGGVSIYSYDKQGMLQSFAGTLYDFRLVGSQVEADIVSTDGTTVLGHVLVGRAGSSRNLVGTLAPPTGGQFAISYKYAASEGPLPGQTYAPVVLPPRTGTKPSSAARMGGRTKPRPGWGPMATFVGRYRLASATPAPQAPPQDGIFTLAIETADRLTSSAHLPTSGQLTLFMRTVKKTEPPVPSGILNIATPAGNFLTYLTYLKSAGSSRSATVNGGSFLGPPIGTLSDGTFGYGILSATISAHGLGPVSVRFVRFSHSPKP
jgi:hypothetical protein